ncbi:MAG: DNA repair protein RadC [Bacteroidia bacterium]|jgi:DNA repair protein RadC|nr:DNA repair protein RadC [Bacteroidia bacterium]
MKSLAEDDRPREKLLNLGRHSLSDAELLAIIMGSGNKGETAVQLAQRMLSEHGNSISQLAKLSIAELKKYKGVGTVKAIEIAAAFELGRRRKDSEPIERIKISSSRHAYESIRHHLMDQPHEEFWVLILNRANQIIKEVHLSKGGVSGTVVDVKLICKAAIDHTASGIILAHNHPSGQVVPSEQDKHITKKIREALALFDIVLLDHLIIGDQTYLSFADEHLL